MANLPADVVNQALDAIGSEVVIGDLEEGTREAQVCLRAYGQCVRQLLRAAHWDFARKTAPLFLLADGSGQTPNVGTVVPVPWQYEYQYPADCVKARFVPVNAFNSTASGAPGNIMAPPNPVAQVGSPTQSSIRMVPARFTVATDFNNIPPMQGQYWEQPGVSPTGQTVILTNVAQAQLVYTSLVMFPSIWDALFRAAFVAYLASEVALTLSKDKKFGLELRGQQIAVAKSKLQQARITDGNEGWYSTDHTPDWMRIRDSGTRLWGAGGFAAGMGTLGYGWDTCGFSDGSAY